MTPDQEKCIVNKIDLLKQKTSNLKSLTTELLQHGVISLAEKQNITSKQDIEDKAELLYEIVIKKSPVCFKLLMKCLRFSGNTSMAVLLEETLDEMKKGKLIYRRSSSAADRYIKEDVGNTLIQGREMGIAEILVEDSTFANNWKLIFYLLNISDRSLPIIENYGNYIVKVTIILREWAEQEKLKGSLSNLTSILEKRGYSETSVKIQRMFEDFSAESESGFLFNFQMAAICEQELEIAKVLEDNPDFALQWEKLFLLLQLPMEYFQQFSNYASFVDNAKRMLTLWKEIGSCDPTFYELARLLVQNGHRNTGGKILVLATM